MAAWQKPSAADVAAAGAAQGLGSGATDTKHPQHHASGHDVLAAAVAAPFDLSAFGAALLSGDNITVQTGGSTALVNTDSSGGSALQQQLTTSTPADLFAASPFNAAFLDASHSTTAEPDRARPAVATAAAAAAAAAAATPNSAAATGIAADGAWANGLVSAPNARWLRRVLHCLRGGRPLACVVVRQKLRPGATLQGLAKIAMATVTWRDVLADALYGSVGHGRTEAERAWVRAIRTAHGLPPRALTDTPRERDRDRDRDRDDSDGDADDDGVRGGSRSNRSCAVRMDANGAMESLPYGVLHSVFAMDCWDPNHCTPPAPGATATATATGTASASASAAAPAVGRYAPLIYPDDPMALCDARRALSFQSSAHHRWPVLPADAFDYRKGIMALAHACYDALSSAADERDSSPSSVSVSGSASASDGLPLDACALVARYAYAPTVRLEREGVYVQVPAPHATGTASHSDDVLAFTVPPRDTALYAEDDGDGDATDDADADANADADAFGAGNANAADTTSLAGSMQLRGTYQRLNCGGTIDTDPPLFIPAAVLSAPLTLAGHTPAECFAQLTVAGPEGTGSLPSRVTTAAGRFVYHTHDTSYTGPSWRQLRLQAAAAATTTGTAAAAAAAVARNTGTATDAAGAGADAGTGVVAAAGVAVDAAPARPRKSGKSGSTRRRSATPQRRTRSAAALRDPTAPAFTASTPAANATDSDAAPAFGGFGADVQSALSAAPAAVAAFAIAAAADAPNRFDPLPSDSVATLNRKRSGSSGAGITSETPAATASSSTPAWDSLWAAAPAVASDAATTAAARSAGATGTSVSAAATSTPTTTTTATVTGSADAASDPFGFHLSPNALNSLWDAPILPAPTLGDWPAVAGAATTDVKSDDSSKRAPDTATLPVAWGGGPAAAAASDIGAATASPFVFAAPAAASDAPSATAPVQPVHPAAAANGDELSFDLAPSVLRAAEEFASTPVVPAAANAAGATAAAGGSANATAADTTVQRQRQQQARTAAAAIAAQPCEVQYSMHWAMAPGQFQDLASQHGVRSTGGHAQLSHDGVWLRLMDARNALMTREYRFYSHAELSAVRADLYRSHKEAKAAAAAVAAATAAAAAGAARASPSVVAATRTQRRT